MAGEPEALSLALWIGGSLGAAGAAFWQGRKRRETPPGEATVLAASIVPQAAMRDLQSTIANADGTMRVLMEKVVTLTNEVEKLGERIHDDAVYRMARGNRE